MPFIGVLPGRAHLFRPEPRTAVAVSDAAAWRLNPAHRHVYDRLAVALAAGLKAAPCGVAPGDLGIAPDVSVFVKPIINLAGMGLGAHAARADQVPATPGAFWCERLTGPHTSTDCLVRDGAVLWLAHTRAADIKDAERPLYWQVGADVPGLAGVVADWVRGQLAGYTGLCNLELIGGRPIEAHLRGSNGFFDLYGPGFMPAWVALCDGEPVTAPAPVPGGFVISVFGEADLGDDALRTAAAAGVSVQPDHHTPGRAAILRCRDLAAGRAAYRRISGRELP